MKRKLKRRYFVVYLIGTKDGKIASSSVGLVKNKNKMFNEQSIINNLIRDGELDDCFIVNWKELSHKDYSDYKEVQ